MGIYAVDFVFKCKDDTGEDLSDVHSCQEMDAFIGYCGEGRDPPSVIEIAEDRTVRDKFTGELYDPRSWGHESD